MFESLVERLTGLADALAGMVAVLDSDAMSAESASRAWGALDRLERLASAGKVLLARRVAQAAPPSSGPGSGARTPAESIAARAGTGLGAAREALETSHRLTESTCLDRAVRDGRLSTPQAAVIASAVAADPAAAERLVELAGTASLTELREECARVRAAADPDPGARNARLHRARRLRRFTDQAGAWQLLARGTPQAGAAFNAVLDPLIDQVFRAARRDGRAEPLEAYAFDALMALADLAAGDPPECLRASTRPEGPEGDGRPVPQTTGAAMRAEPQAGARSPVSAPDGSRPTEVASRAGSGPMALASRGGSRPTDSSAPAGVPGSSDSEPPDVMPAGAVQGIRVPSADRGSEPSSVDRQLDDLPWWAAAQGVVLDVQNADANDGRVRDRSGSRAASVAGHSARVNHRNPAGRILRREPEQDRLSWWRLAHLLDPDDRTPIQGRGPSRAPAGTGSPCPDTPLNGILGPEQGRSGASVQHHPAAPGRPAAVEPEDSVQGTPSGRSGAPRVRPGVGLSAAALRNPRHLALLRVDLTALRRGSPEAGETCEIAGVGPVPVDVARELLGDAVLKLVITRGVDVVNVTHLGRGPTAAQRVALTWQTPGCSVVGCPRRRVEIDHREEWARTRHTRLDELDPLCGHHHDLKTRFGWALVEGTGRRAFVPPSDPRHPRRGASAAAEARARTRASGRAAAREDRGGGGAPSDGSTRESGSRGATSEGSTAGSRGGRAPAPRPVRGPVEGRVQREVDTG